MPNSQLLILNNTLFVISSDSRLLLKCRVLCTSTESSCDLYFEFLHTEPLARILVFLVFFHILSCLRRWKALWRGCSNCNEAVIKWTQLKSTSSALVTNATDQKMFHVCLWYADCYLCLQRG